MSQKEDIFLWHACQSKNSFALKLTLGIRPYFQVVLLLVSGSRVFARKFRPVDFLRLPTLTQMWEDAWDAWDFCCFHMKNNRKFMEIQVKRLSEVYLLTWNAISKSKTPGHFVLGSCCAVCTSPCFCLCWLDYSQVGGVGVSQWVTCDMVHQFLRKIFISRHRVTPERVQCMSARTRNRSWQKAKSQNSKAKGKVHPPGNYFRHFWVDWICDRSLPRRLVDSSPSN